MDLSRIGLITWQSRLVTGLLRGCGSAGRRGALAARRSRRNERFLVGMAFVDVSREEIASEEEQMEINGEIEDGGRTSGGEASTGHGDSFPFLVVPFSGSARAILQV